MVNEIRHAMNEKERDFEAEILSAFDLPADEVEKLRFINRSGSVNWNTVVAVDIEKMIKDRHYLFLQENVFNIINYDLESKRSAVISDPCFVKLFRMAQLTIEYLLFVHKYMRNLVTHLNNNEKHVIQETENFRKGHNGLMTGLDEYKSTTVNNYNVRKGHRLIVIENESENIFQCSLCGKVFLDENYLTAHQQRRHSGLQQLAMSEVLRIKSSVPTNQQESLPSTLQLETEKIWKELEALRKRVNECESCNIKNKETLNESKNGNDVSRNEGRLLKKKEMDVKPLKEGCSHNKLKISEEEKAETDEKENEDISKVKEDGRLEAQERVWRGRIKALEDKNQKELESLRKIINSYKEKEHALEEKYEQRIEKLTAELREKATRQLEVQMAKSVEEEVVASESVHENIESQSESSDYSEDTSAPSSQPADEGPTDLNSTFTYAADEESKSTGSDIDSSENSSSIAQRTPGTVLEEEEEEVLDGRELTAEIFNRKLKHLGINPKAKKMPQRVFKEKMEVINKQQKDMAKNIEGYHQIKSNIEEKALAKVSQRLQGSHVKHSRAGTAFPSRSLDKVNPKPTKRRDFEPFELSSKNTSIPSTSRTSSSNHSPLLKPKNSVKKSPVMVNTFNTSRPWESVPGPKSSKGVVTITSHVHPKEQGKSLFHGSPGFHAVGLKENRRLSSGGILRGVPFEAGDGNADKRASGSHSLGNIPNKSVSFSLAQNLVQERTFKAL